MARSPQTSATSLQISNDHAAAVGRLLPGINDLYGYLKLDKPGLIHWANEIDRLAPDLDPAKLSLLIDLFKSDVIRWDKSLGIQNIFRGLEEIERDTATGKYQKRLHTW